MSRFRARISAKTYGSRLKSLLRTASPSAVVQHHRQPGYLANLRRKVIAHRGNLRASPTCRAAFLRVPAAFLADNARRQRIHDGRQNLYDPGRQSTIGTVEVWTLVFCTSCGKPENLGGFQGSSHGKNTRGSWQELVQVLQSRGWTLLSNDTQYATPLHARLSAWTKLRHAAPKATSLPEGSAPRVEFQ